MRLYVLVIALFTSLLQADLISPLPTDTKYDQKKALLGKKLFNDPRLSADDTISCASCHLLEDGGDDNIKFSFGINAQEGVINSPTVFNSRYNLSQFWDGRAQDLQAQASQPIHNPIEMGSNMDEVLSKLKKDPEYSVEFKSIYKDAITKENITDAIAEFEKALVTPNSKFDQYLRGDKTALNKEEKEGYKLFKENGCIACHNGINIGGNLYQKVGILKTYVDKKNTLGRYNVTKKEKDKYFFKVPTLRNIELTAPYLHDGSQKNLFDIVNFMTLYQIGMVPDKEEVKKIVSFLKTLTGETPKIMSINEK
ncbi:MAG: c-type cytochrome [Helicobacteraceae bacterium]|nr:c-type cytochrome [Helicobacteraceae bacterium]